MTFDEEGVGEATTIVDHGPDSGKWNLVVLGDGYTQKDIGDATFDRDVTGFVDELRDTAPFGELWSRINVHRITTVSPQPVLSIAGVPTQNTRFNAAFSSPFAGDPTARLLTVDHKEARRIAYALVPQTHQVLVLVNTDEYGGGGGPVAVSSTGQDAFKIAIHELAHSAFGLDDEYETDTGHRPMDEPAAANVTLSNSGAKWKRFMTEPAQFVSHPPDEAAVAALPDETVGVFEGALYCHRYVFRPSPRCRMRELADPFCPVCAEAIRVKLSTFDPAVDRRRTLPTPQGGNTMPDLTPDAVVAAIDNEAVVSLEGYVVDSTQWQDRIELVTDPWLRDRLIIDRLDVVHRIPGSARPSNGQSVLWVKRDAPLLRVVNGTAQQFATGDPKNTGSGGNVGGWSPPPPPWPRH